MPEPQTFGERLRCAYQGRGLRAADVAEALAIDRPAVSRWVNDVRRPSLEQLEQLCALLHVSADVLLGRAPFQLGPVPDHRSE